MAQMLRLSVIVFVIAVANAGDPAMAAELGQAFDSYRDLHRDTQYGALFFNEGSIRTVESRSKKRFKEIVGAGELKLPQQEGYCFVVNHYGSPNDTTGINQKYRAKLSKLLSDGRTTTETIERIFAPTNDLAASKLPDFCVAGIANATKVTVDLSSDDGLFDRTISFSVQ
jgi:hypothetical protein